MSKTTQNAKNKLVTLLIFYLEKCLIMKKKQFSAIISLFSFRFEIGNAFVRLVKYFFSSLTLPWPAFPLIISGAMYSIVPQNEYVLSFYTNKAYQHDNGALLQHNMDTTREKYHLLLFISFHFPTSSSRNSLLSPKSVKTTWPSLSNKMFSSLMSRYTMPSWKHKTK